MQAEAKISAVRGLHARPVANLCSLVKQFDAKVWLSLGEQGEISTEDIMAMMSINAKKGDVIKIRTEGKDEEEAALKIKKFLEEMKD